MALEGDGVGVERLAFEPELEQMVRRDQAGDDRRRAGSEPPGERDLAPDLEAQAVGGVQALEARTQRFDRSVGRSGPASTENSPASVTSSSSESESAAASTS